MSFIDNVKGKVKGIEIVGDNNYLRNIDFLADVIIGIGNISIRQKIIKEIRDFKNEGWENYRKMLLSAYPQRDAEENFEHAARQTYIAFMAAITQAAYEGVDSTPMEGFDPDALDKIIGLREKGLRSTLLLPIGYKDADKDWLVNLVKVRKPMKELVTLI